MKSQSDPKICVLSVNSSNCSDEPSNRSAVPKTKADDLESDRYFTPGDREDDPEPDRYRMPDLQTDDPAALAALVADYLPLVRRAARCMPEREQEDAIAEGQYQLIRAIKAYDPNTGLDLPGYLKIKIKYGMFNYFRRYRCEADRTVAEADILTRAEALQAVQPDPMDSPAAQVLHHLDEERLRTALDALSPGERACLEALYWMGMGYDETAQAMGVTANTVTKMRSRALKKLKIRMV